MVRKDQIFLSTNKQPLVNPQEMASTLVIQCIVSIIRYFNILHNEK